MSSPARYRLPLLLVLWGGLVAVFAFGTARFLDPDEYFHVAVARHFLTDGWVLHTFPWVTESVWVDHYFDKEWLFHVALALLQPLGALGGAKTLIVLLNLLVVCGLWFLARRLQIAAPFWWLLFLPFWVLADFWQRLLVCRPHLLSLALLAFCLGAMIQRRHLLLAVLTFIYAWSYTGHWQLLGLALAADGLAALWADNGHWRGRLHWRQWPVSATVLLAMVAGALLHPHFPANLAGLWMQNVRVLQEYWRGGSEILPHRPMEIRGVPLLEFVRQYALLLAALAVIVVHALRRRVRQPRVLLLFAGYTLLYGVMTWKSQRFAEYFVPVSVLFIAAYSEQHRLLAAVQRPLVRRLVMTVLGLYALLGLFSAYREDVLLPRFQGLNQPQYAGAAAWLRTHLQPGEVVFTVSWSDPPMLFFGAPDQRYLVFLDLFFMYAYSPDRFREWNFIRQGATADPAGLIQRDFHSRVVVTHLPSAATDLLNKFYEQLSATPGVEKVYTGPEGDVIFLLSPVLPAPPPPSPTKGP